MQCLSFERVCDHGSREALAHPDRLRLVEVAAADGPAFAEDLEEAPELGAVRFSVGVPRDSTDIVNSVEHDQRADFEATGKTLQLIRKRCIGAVFGRYRIRGYEEFGRHAVALALDLQCRRAHEVGGRQRSCANPQVREFVSQGEDLCGLRVSPVDEDERRERIGEGETAELVWIELSVRVACRPLR